MHTDPLITQSFSSGIRVLYLFSFIPSSSITEYTLTPSLHYRLVQELFIQSSSITEYTLTPSLHYRLVQELFIQSLPIRGHTDPLTVIQTIQKGFPCCFWIPVQLPVFSLWFITKGYNSNICNNNSFFLLQVEIPLCMTRNLLQYSAVSPAVSQCLWVYSENSNPQACF